MPGHAPLWQPAPAESRHAVTRPGLAAGLCGFLSLLLSIIIPVPPWAAGKDSASGETGTNKIYTGRPDMPDLSTRDTAATAKLRASMVAEQISARGVTDPLVLAAMARVPRHDFVPEAVKTAAYEDFPLPIGYGQTISQPYIVAFMTQAASIQPGEKVLEIGTGSGYQAAVLAEVAGGSGDGGGRVFTIEIVEPLGRRAAATLAGLGYRNISCRVGDGYAGWPEEAPFDAILVTAAPDHVPQPLVEQLREGGRMVIPVGVGVQELVVSVKERGKLRTVESLPVRFVPMTGDGVRKRSVSPSPTTR